MGKVEIGIYFCATADILTKKYRNVAGVVLYQPCECCQNHWFWLVAMETERLNFRKKIFKNLLLRSHKGVEAETLHKCSWHEPLHKLYFLLPLSMCFRCYGNLKFPYTCTYNGKSGNWHLFLCYCRCFDTFYWNVSGVVLCQPYEFCPNRWFWLVAMATEKLNFWEQKQHAKIFFSEAIWGMKLKLCIHVYDSSLYIIMFYIVVAHVLSLL